MAAPNVNVSPSSVTLVPGGAPVVVTVTASDPDELQGQVEFPVTDSQGNSTSVFLDLHIDPLTHDAPDEQGLPVTVTKISESAGVAVYEVAAL